MTNKIKEKLVYVIKYANLDKEVRKLLKKILNG